MGNENWGCSGNFSPENYCTEFRRYASFIRGFGKKLFVIACGPAGNDVEWTDRFFRKLNKDYWVFNNIDGFAAHYYCGTAGTATEYTEEEFYRLLEKGLKMEDLVIQQRAALDVWDLGRKIGLIVVEWGTWHPVEKGTIPSILYQQNPIRDAIVAANTLDIFNRDADKLPPALGGARGRRRWVRLGARAPPPGVALLGRGRGAGAAAARPRPVGVLKALAPAVKPAAAPGVKGSVP